MDAARIPLHPPIEPYDRFRLQVSSLHTLYVEQCGRPDGAPVVVLHGGPGGGCSPAMRRFFDPRVFRAVLFDQRGCGRSQPNAEVEENTSWTLVEDIERIRERLGIEKWIVFGGSWGATLALLYAETYPERVEALILRGVFLLRRREIDWFYNGGAAHFWPDLWERFIEPIPAAERDDMVAAYHRRLFCDDRDTQLACARAWSRWESATAAFRGDARRRVGFENDAYALAFARIENHFFHNGGFLEHDDQILRNAHRLADTPGVIVQGRYDMICPPVSAYELARAWPKARLTMIEDAGHALSEPGVSAALVAEMNALAQERR
ncbi:MAG: prolyl aminopeptidase [Neomegalonema sp.]|nr:prolyl aminopeptidase [Neomegalonema sp.]